MEKYPSFLFLLLLLLPHFSKAATESSSIDNRDLKSPCNCDESNFLPTCNCDEMNALNIIAYKLGIKLEQSFYSGSCKDPTFSDLIACDCKYENGTLCHVTSITFNRLDLSGTIPAEFANLTYLQQIDLSRNQLYGPIPTFLSNLRGLTTIYLYTNYLNGSIPASLGSLPSLKHLDVWNNKLHGRIPMELGNLTTLTYLDLAENRFFGELPETLGNLKNLQSLKFSQNEFTGTLPTSFANLKKLQFVNALGNNFSGPIPKVIESWDMLIALFLIGNKFTGPFPKFGFQYLTRLWIADLPGNSDEGFLFPDISSMKNLRYLILRNCSIAGRIPDYIGKMTSLLYLDLSFNKLSGEVPKSISNLSLSTIYLTGNKLNGSIPTWSKHSNLMDADFSNNNFTNASFIHPNSHSNHTNLFACCSPSVTNLTSSPWLISNFYCDEKPKNKYLFINCGGESVIINGSTYEADLQKEGKSAFYISHNRNWAYSSTGDFIGLGSYPFDYVQSETFGNSLGDGPLYSTARISPLSLKYYGFCLVNGNYTVNLYFAEIVFAGAKDYSNKGSRVFDIFIQGKIVLKNFNITRDAGGPRKAVVKTFTVVLEDRPLEIHFYWAGKGSIYIPPGLYGPLISAISVSPVTFPKGSGLSVITIAGIGGFAFLLILVLGFLWKMGWLRGKKSPDDELKILRISSGESFTFRQIKAATQDFSNKNKIGEGGFGSVYKGVLPNEMTVAVKQLSSKSRQGVREFLNEVTTISALNHPNLVRLLGCCAEKSQFLLVYEYMENNSLASALFGSTKMRRRLDWPTRIKICLGIARGLAFLHEESELKMIHRDIKPTNVLLDRDLNAKISDFGLAKLDEGENTHVTTKIVGTTLYMAPEYAMRGCLTNKADVYSFGAVTLEILSGRRSASSNVDNDETVYLVDTAFILQQKGNLQALIDPDLGRDYPVKEAKKILDLAIACLNFIYEMRPTMSQVVKILEGKAKLQTPTVHVQYLTDNLKRTKALADHSHSSQSGNDSKEGTSHTFSSDIERNMEEACEISLQNTPPEISEISSNSQEETS